jgi:hypothetical protein
MRLVPAVQQHCKLPASALVSALTHPGTTAPAAHLAPVTPATWGHMHNRLPVGFPLPATYSSGAGSSDAIPPSNLPSECHSSSSALSTGVKRLGCGCNPGHAGVTGSIPTAVENCGLYILGRLSVTSAQVASRQGGGGLGGLPLFMCPHVIIIQACVSRPQTAPPSQGAGPMGGILWRYGAKGGPYGLLLLLLSCTMHNRPECQSGVSVSAETCCIMQDRPS